MGRNPRPVLVLGVVCALLIVLFTLTLVRTGHPQRPEPAPDASAAAVEVQPGAEEGTFTLWCPDLGKADAFLLQGEAGAVLLDAGEDPEPVLNLLREHNVTKLDALVLSHFDKDHIGGAAAVLEQVEVQTLYRTAYVEDSEPYAALMRTLSVCGTEVVTVTDTLTVTAAGAELTLYPPLSSSYGKDEDNNASLLTAVDAGGSSLLFAGDAMKPRIREFLEEQFDGTAYQFLKVPHHGGETKPTALLLEAFTPRYALITASAAQPESDKLLERLEEAGVEVLCTRMGAVTLRCQDGRIERLS